MTELSNGKHTHTEIFSQPDIWQATLHRLSEMDPTQIPDPTSYQRLLFTGCGSTYYLSLWAARMAEATNGVIARAAPASDLLLFPSSWLQKGTNTLLVAISRSAETSETLRSVETFHAGGYGDSLAITCYPDRRLTALTTKAISTPDAQEEGIAQTRSFTSMMLAIAWWLLPDPPRGFEDTLTIAAKQLIDTYAPLASELGRDTFLQRFFFLGSGPLYGVASEAMLKMKEISLSYSEAYHFLEFRHGPKSMVDDQSLVIGLLSEQAQDHELAVMREMQDLGARTIILAESPNNKIEQAGDSVVTLASGLPSGWRAPLYLPFLQLLALQRALAKGLNPDQPANLDPVVILDV
ncbi:MAG: SIS domain-containing protein [Anaerolineales bacterium]